MALHETPDYQTRGKGAAFADALAHAEARWASAFLYGDAMHEYKTRFAAFLREGTAYSAETQTNAYKIASVAFTIAYINADAIARYDILHPTNRSPFAPANTRYRREINGFSRGITAGYADLQFAFNTKGTKDPASPEAITRAIIKTLKKTSNAFGSLAYTEPTLADQGVVLNPATAFSEYHLPLNKRLTLRVTLYTDQFRAISDIIPLLSDSPCQFGLIVHDPDGQTARNAEHPMKQAVLRNLLAPDALWQEIAQDDPDVARTDHWIRYDLPPEVTPADLEEAFDALYENKKSASSGKKARFTRLLYSVISIPASGGAPPVQRLVISVSETAEALQKRKKRKFRARMKRRQNLSQMFTGDLAILPPDPR